MKTRWHLTTTRQEKRELRHLQGQCGNPVIMVRLARLSTAPPPPPVALTCRAHMSDSTPAQYSYDHVIVKTGQPDASVRAVAHDKTTSTPKGGTSGSDAVANLTFYIAGATPGYRVHVSVTVKKNGRTRTCGTSVTPHARACLPMTR